MICLSTNLTSGYAGRTTINDTISHMYKPNAANNSVNNVSKMISYISMLQASAVSPNYADAISGVIGFDTTLAKGMTVKSAIIYTRSSSCVANLGAFKVDVFSTTNDQNLGNADYDNSGDVSLSGEKLWSAISTVGYTAWVLNAQGIAHLSLTGVGTKISKFCFRCNFDYNYGVDSPTWASSQVNSCSYYPLDKGVGYYPYLVLVGGSGKEANHYLNGFRTA